MTAVAPDSLPALEDSLRSARERLLQGDLAGVRALCLPLAQRWPTHGECLHLLALCASYEGDLKSAADLIAQALHREPQRVLWQRDAAILHASLEQWPSAAGYFSAWFDSSPHETAGLLTYARALRHLEQFDEAAAQAELALAAEPEAAHKFLAEIYEAAGLLAEEQVHREALIRLRPQAPQSWLRLARVQSLQGDAQSAADTLRAGLAACPNAPELHSVLVSYLLNDPSQTGIALREEHEAWARAQISPGVIAPHTNVPDPERPLRLGYLTGEFLRSASSWFLPPILENHDTAGFETFFYHAHRGAGDELTRHYQGLAHHWRAVSGQSPAAIAQQIRADGIDILVDLSGHYTDNGLLTFAQRPAPVQIALPNYPSTTGLSCYNALLTDHWTSPPGSDNEYTEPLYRLPVWYLPYRPPAEPPVAPLPALHNGYVTFGLLQRHTKTTPDYWRAVAAILQQVPNSRLLVHYAWSALNDREDPVCTRVLDLLQADGIAPERIEFRGSLPVLQHLQYLSQHIDIALDTFPYNGQTTTCECLWMGVPVVTLAGATHVSRVGQALLQHAGLPGWIATTPAEYISLAVQRASGLGALASTRAGLREQLRRSTLMDAARVTREIETAYRDLWRRWCARQVTP